eukprot:SAG11_NODE_67_length_18762_cov_13.942560_22_plen_401_part_00
MANSTCCKYKSGKENREYIPSRWSLSANMPLDDNFPQHKFSSPYDGKTIREVLNELIADNNKKELCSLHYTISWALDNIPIYQYNEIAEEMLKTIDEHCEKCGKKEYKCKCIKELGGEEEYNTKSTSCEKGTTWKVKKCKCVKNPKLKPEEGDVKPVEDEKDVSVCMDKKAFNYEEVGGCVFRKEIELENKFCFCITDTCEEVGRCIQGTQVLNIKANSYGSFEKIYNRIYEKVLTALAKLTNPFDFRISTEKGFYAATINNSYVIDLAKALTILELRNYSLSALGADKLLDSDLVVQDQNGDYIGFFSGASMTSPMFKNFNLQLTDPIIRFRVSKNVGGEIVNSRHIPHIQRIISKNGRESDEVENIAIYNNGMVVKESNVGLINVLKEEPIGLAKLLK